jgi:hypothetical protein
VLNKDQINLMEKHFLHLYIVPETVVKNERSIGQRHRADFR